MRATERFIDLVLATQDRHRLETLLNGFAEGIRGTEQPSLSGEVRERAAIVKYLRAAAETRAPTSVFRSCYLCLAAEIESGEHVP